LLLLVALLVASPGTEAERLFRLGREALARKEHEQACALFEKSLELDPALGTLLNLGECLEGKNQLAAAWSHFDAASRLATSAKDPGRALLARKRADQLKGRLVFIKLRAGLFPLEATLVVDEGKPKPLTGEVEVPLEPGTHRLVVSAPGQLPQQLTDNFSQPGETREWMLTFTSPEQHRPVRVGVTAAGAALLATSVASLSYCLVRHAAFERQLPGGPDFDRPTVGRGELATLQWLYPASWVGAGVGAAALVAGLISLLQLPAQVSWVPVPGGFGLAIGGGF
jgi:tetratricopeptide (TPR) repeat protein